MPSRFRLTLPCVSCSTKPPLATPEFEKSGYFRTVHDCLSMLTE
jgi:hypothetical protein